MRWALDELGVGMEHVIHSGALPPPVVSRKLYEIVAVVAQQFRGFIYRASEPQVVPARPAAPLSLLSSRRRAKVAMCDIFARVASLLYRCRRQLVGTPGAWQTFLAS